MKKWTLFFGIFLILLIAAGLYLYKHYASQNFTYAIRNIPQNADDWLDQKTENTPILSAQLQQQYAKNYLQHYFSPWSPDYFRYFPVLTIPISNFQQLKDVLQKKIESYQANPGYGINHLPNSKAWIDTIANNMDLAHFPNANIKVISISETNMRDLPTSQPSFGKWDQAGEGYPFDYLQATTLAPNTPALVLHKTRDGAWSLIVTNNSFGWVSTYALATVNDAFIHHWQTIHYVTLTQDSVPIVDNQKIARFSADIGKIFPLASHQIKQKSGDNYPILIAVADANQQAVIKTGYLSRQVATPWPITATPRNIAAMMNAMLHVKYGWGGMTGDCDCSFTTMDLFSTVGIWLPRNSSEQALTGRGIDLTHLSSLEKKKIISAQGVPFLTLLHMPGHITVYIGQKKKQLYLFQTVWGVHTRNILGEDGRAILGDTVITPIDLGKGYWNVTDTLLERMDRMILFNTLELIPHNHR